MLSITHRVVDAICPAWLKLVLIRKYQVSLAYSSKTSVGVLDDGFFLSLVKSLAFAKDAMLAD